MSEIIARCGYRCDLCPAYRDNIHGPEDQQRCSDGWFKHYGFRIPPGEIRCDGCWDPRPDARRTDSTCKVRPCVIERGLITCAACEQCPCDELKARLVSRAQVETHVGGPIEQDDYESFVYPYEAEKVLDRLREESAS